MANGYKHYLSVTGVMIVTVSLLTGVAFGATSGYVLANAWVARGQPPPVQFASFQQPLDPATLPAAPPALSPPITQTNTFLPPLTSPATDYQQNPIPPTEYSPVEAVNKVLPAVVTVLTDGGPFGEGSGSGFFISADGYLVTNYHVVADADELEIIYAEGGLAEAELIGKAPQFDLAVLKVDGAVPAVAEWGDSGDMPLGAEVIAIGSALGRYQNTVTAGVLSGYNRELGGLQALLQTDAAINQGNSGGPLINTSGQVIGINTLMIRGGLARAEGLSFAMPSNVARNVVQNLISRGEIRAPYLGARYQELSRGVLVREVLSNTPAKLAGLRKGDIIVSINGHPVDERHPLISLLLEHQVGDAVILEMRRDDRSFQARLVLGEQT